MADILWKALTSSSFWSGVFAVISAITPVIWAAITGFVIYLIRKVRSLGGKVKATETKLTNTENKLTDKVWLREAFETELQELLLELGILRKENKQLKAEVATLKKEIDKLKGDPIKPDIHKATSIKYRKRTKEKEKDDHGI